ncbi:Hypothetical protein FKW44_001027 [Caligus rogercresseyi]|uniref:Uncharacterized protein n=1 Tax=Caligus rogercresseyi TaxID=217165 RepID=A0A7T8KI89_CALRO|nr:Hypothetical protein FKW44_001027 [Caligus rogercresseyi]
MHYRTLNSRQGGNPGGRPITEEENDDQHPPLTHPPPLFRSNEPSLINPEWL